MLQKETNTKGKSPLINIPIEDYLTMNNKDKLRIIDFYLSKYKDI